MYRYYSRYVFLVLFSVSTALCIFLAINYSNDAYITGVSGFFCAAIAQLELIGRRKI